MKLIVLIFSFLLSLAGFSQQDSSYVLLRSFQGDIAGAAIDNLDNLYVISSSGQVRKYTSSGDSAAIYNQVRNYGQLGTIDVSNPMRPLLFYRDFSTVVLLDRFLSQRAVLDLRKFRILQPTAAALSYDNNIWVFDAFDNKLKKVDEQGNVVMSTPDFRMLFNTEFTPTRIINDNGMVYLADSSRGIYVFDNYGAFRKKLAITNWKDFSVQQNHVVYLDPEGLVIHNTSNFMERKKPFNGQVQALPGSYIHNNRIIRFDREKLLVYRF